MERLRRIRVRITGQVQGVGFRPFVWNRAEALELTGFVHNDSLGVTVEVQGDSRLVDQFLLNFEQELPPLAVVDSLITEELSCREENSFTILESHVTAGDSTRVAPDLAMCSECCSEIQDPQDQRYCYPFTNCTNCGPRFTIVEDIPYDRALTTMKSFVMCDRCQREYNDPSNRRFHAQPNACPECGPTIWFAAKDQISAVLERPNESVLAGQESIDLFASAVLQGKIVAVKGVGGFHLACNPCDPQVVHTLRDRKGRIDKPFAVIVRDVEQAATFAHVDVNAKELLESQERPIVLLRKRQIPAYEAMLESVAPGNDFVGVFLPYSPLHYLLVKSVSPLLMTSGNVSDEPIVRTNEEARERLSALADGFLLHNRDIHVACDDSVVRSVSGKVLPIRRSRGYAPMPIRLSESGPNVLGVGGEIKSTFCVTKSDYAYLSQHIGDVANLETLDALQRSVRHFLRLFRVEVEAVACDLHPNYVSSRWAQELASELDVPLVKVQHHLAHAFALLAEHRWESEKQILACCFDGTGYGTDGTIWGGEFLLVGSQDFERFAHLDNFLLPGGDASIKYPYRTALALLSDYQIEWDELQPCVAACGENEKRILRQQLEKQINCVESSSVGRLFDAVASLLGIRHRATYEAQAAIEMEAIASEELGNVDPYAYRFEMHQGQVLKIRVESLLQAICADVRNGIALARIAAQFHHAVANMIASVCKEARRKVGVNTVGLSGGVFQNVVLAELTEYLLRSQGFEVLTHSLVPPNDGGLALGQVVVARNQLLKGL